ncbi:hypothetical protein N9850_12480 [Granulosicoccus sp.]|nr:hypothetical protein [Granulosicoccus sp.]MDB4224580.1 hypothetical protein [Granulosicoccus sp.]
MYKFLFSRKYLPIAAIFLLTGFSTQAALYENFYEQYDLGPVKSIVERAAPNGRDLRKSYFVDSIKGSNDHDGSFTRPWGSLKYSVEKLKPGDTLFIRGGTYDESDIQIRLDGNLDQPISIVGYPGETVIVDGSLTGLRQNFNSNWELLNSETALYGSTSKVDPSRHYLATINYEGVKERLITYYLNAERDASGFDDLIAEKMGVSKQPKYAGPGVYNLDGRLFLRLAPPVEVAGLESRGIDYEKLNPDLLQMSVSSRDSIFDISGDYLVFENIRVSGAYKAFRIRSNSNNLEFRNVTVSSSAIGILAEGVVSSVTLDGVEIEGDFPSWLAWSDMKGSSAHSKPASHWLMKSVGFSGKSVVDLVIKNSWFNDVFDGLVVGGSDIHVHNNSFSSIDDMIQLASDSSRIQINNNVVYGAGPSHNGKFDSELPGTKYIHHNLIDSTRKVLFSREDPEELLNKNQLGVLSTIPFPRHNIRGAGRGDPWKIYNNTVVYDSTGYSIDPGYQLWGQINSTGQMHEVYNNIFWDLGLGIFTRRVSSKQVLQNYDGNIYWADGSNSDLILYKSLKGWDDKKQNLSLPEIKQYVTEQPVPKTNPLSWDKNSIVVFPNLDERLVPKKRDTEFLGVSLPEKWPNSDKRFVGAINNNQ